MSPTPRPRAALALSLLAPLALACGSGAATAPRPTEVRTVAAGDAPARHQLGEHTLYLAPGSTARVGTVDGRTVVELAEGRARLVAARGLLLDGAGERQDVSGRDLVLERGRDGRLRSAPTAARPDLALAIATEHPIVPGGIGRLEARAEGGAPAEALALRRLAIDVRREGDLAYTVVEHVFHNPADQVREGTFRFPLPADAMLLGLAMEIDGRLMEGSIVERERARQIYEKIVDDMQDPALLEWEEGSWFKLRVFPIEARSDKRVVLRYAAPLRRTLEGWELDHAIEVPADAPPIDELVVTVDGEERERRRGATGGVALTVPVAADAVPRVLREETDGGVYTAVRIAPALDRARPRAAAAGGRRVAVVVDTSRSALEARALTRELVAATLAELAAGDRFVLAAADVTIRFHADDFVAATDEARAAALAFLDAIEPDGASDLAAALDAAAARRPTAIVYLGDGTPTWGVTAPAALRERAAAAGVPVHAALLGRSTDLALWRELAGASGGRALAVKTAPDARRFALVAARADQLRRLERAAIAPVAGATIYPAGPTTLYEGDELVALIRTDEGAPLPAALTLEGELDGRRVTQAISLAGAAPVRVVSQRWAIQHLAAREAAGAPKEELVALSIGHGVLSRHTSLLVLESEEAYREHQIARQAEQAAAPATGDAPRVTGGDLDSLGARRPSLSPDEIQPGDPEIKIPAPADARAVVVDLPTGETKLATWDDEVGAWMIRFLVDKATPDGRYWASIAITHADGRVEHMRLPYLVDTLAPAIVVDVVRRGATVELTARQQGRGQRRAVERVEVELPGGEVVRLQPVAPGRFAATATLADPLAAGTLRFVASDRALNQATVEVALDAAGAER